MTPAELLALVDLTRLERPDEPRAIDALAAKAVTPSGRVAALCVYPEWVERVAGAGVAVAAVVAFPEGPDDPPAAAREAAEAVAAGAAEIDVVVPWRAFLGGADDAIGRTVEAVRAAVGEAIVVKAILETGSLPDAETIRAAGVAALEAGADFLKTSSGKVGPGASPAAVRELLEVVLAGGRGGVKASGGIRTAEEAQAYVDLAGEVMGPGWVAPARFRFGASSLVDDLRPGPGP
jgi:deoxyribose-phosphate aldolase